MKRMDRIALMMMITSGFYYIAAILRDAPIIVRMILVILMACDGILFVLSGD